ncbi:MAG: hypothetical protein IPM97_13050 [Bdellovibrionaceae bacterium]|nr:hypothetical protein [Pseudobdellovibrionaceae bacterium]
MTCSRWILFAFAIISITSCGKEVKSELVLTAPAATAYVLPQTLTSCDAKLTGATTGDLSKNTFQFKKLSIKWENTADKVNIISLQLRFKHSNIVGGEYESCLIAGDELSAAFYTSGARWTGEILAGATAANDACPISCGGFKVEDKDKAFTVSGTITAMGIQTDANTGDEKFVKGSTDVKLIFQGGFQ